MITGDDIIRHYDRQFTANEPVEQEFERLGVDIESVTAALRTLPGYCLQMHSSFVAGLCLGLEKGGVKSHDREPTESTDEFLESLPEHYGGSQ